MNAYDLIEPGMKLRIKGVTMVVDRLVGDEEEIFIEGVSVTVSNRRRNKYWCTMEDGSRKMCCFDDVRKDELIKWVEDAEVYIPK